MPRAFTVRRLRRDEGIFVDVRRGIGDAQAQFAHRREGESRELRHRLGVGQIVVEIVVAGESPSHLPALAGNRSRGAGRSGRRQFLLFVGNDGRLDQIAESADGRIHIFGVDDVLLFLWDVYGSRIVNVEAFVFSWYLAVCTLDADIGTLARTPFSLPLPHSRQYLH